MFATRSPYGFPAVCVLMIALLVTGCVSTGYESVAPLAVPVEHESAPAAAAVTTEPVSAVEDATVEDATAAGAEVADTAAELSASETAEQPAITNAEQTASATEGTSAQPTVVRSVPARPTSPVRRSPRHSAPPLVLADTPAETAATASLRSREPARRKRGTSPVIRLDGRDLLPSSAAPAIQQTAAQGEASSADADAISAALDPAPPRALPVPLQGAAPEAHMEIDGDEQFLSLSVRDAPLNSVLSLIAEQQGINIVTGSDLTFPVTVTLHDVTVDRALNSILRIAGCAWYRESDIIYVSIVDTESHVAPNVQGREVRVFSLDYVSATDVEKVVRGLLSPVGNIFASESDSKNKRRTGESVVVEDLPAYLRRVEQYIAQIDQPPRQVLIEAHILEVQLSDNMTHGVNFDYLAEISNTQLRLETTGFANPAATSGMLFSIDGSDLTSLVEALQTTNDAKTLASPKVLVLNGQEARIQIGEQLGYFLTTTTQTSTLQQVQFLDVGIVLRVTPQIAADGQVIMSVQPEVSSGAINDTTGLPDKATTEVETSVILRDGRGIIIGGLIREADTDKQSKLPFVGDLWAVGRAFQRRVGVRERSEIVVALVPRVVPYTGNRAAQDELDLHRATTPLLDENLKRYPRPGEGALPDAMRDPRRIELKRLPDAVRNLNDPYPLPPEYYLPANSEHGAYCPDGRYDVTTAPVIREASGLMLDDVTLAPYDE